MADINIQRKKTSPSPWLLVLLAAVVLAVAAYFFLKSDPADESAAPAAEKMVLPAADTLAAAKVLAQARAADSTKEMPDAMARATPNPPGSATAPPDASPMGLEAVAADNPAAPDYARQGLRTLASLLVSLADREDLRTPTITEQRDNLTSATARLDEQGGSLRPGFVAAAALVRAMQQQSYPELDAPAADLVQRAGQLTGRSDTPARQQQNKEFLTRAAAFMHTLSQPPLGQL